MNRVLAALALGGSGLLIAAPAAAQGVFSISVGSGGYGYSSPYGYDYGYNQGYGYNSGWVQTQALQARISNVFRSLGSVRPDQRYQIRAEAIALNRELRIASANGLDPYELTNLDRRLNRLERREQWASMNGWSNGYNGYYGNNRDRDEDGDRDDDGDRD